MKKFISVLTVLLLVVISAVPAFAAGINENEQKVLNELSKKVQVGSGYFMIPAEYINQAENYFNTIDMTAAEADEIIGYVKQGEDLVISKGATDFKQLTYDDKMQLVTYGQAAVGVLGMTLTVEPKGNIVTILAPDGKVAFTAEAKMIPFVENPTDGPTNGTTNGGNNKPGGNVVKPTGMVSDSTNAIVLTTVIVLFVAVAGIYLVKTKKVRE